MVVKIWVSFSCTSGAPLWLINEKLGAETGDLAMTYKLVVAAVGLCRHTVGSSGRFCWEWSNGNALEIGVCKESLCEVWQLLLFDLTCSCGTTNCRFQGGVFYAKEKWKIVTTRPSARSCLAFFVASYLLVLHFTRDGEELCLCFHQASTTSHFLLLRRSGDCTSWECL